MATEVGANQRVRARHDSPVEAEWYKRTYWCMLCSDMILSVLLGRSKLSNSADFEIDLKPLEREDPILVKYAFSLVNLMQILQRIQDEIPSLIASFPFSRKDRNLEQTVIGLDSALNQWVDTIPEECKSPDRIRLNQSACLYATYYVRLLLSRTLLLSLMPSPFSMILLHRHFISTPGKEANFPATSLPSLAICASAARSCCHVMAVQIKRSIGPLHNPQLLNAVFDAATVLIFSVHKNARSADSDPSIRESQAVLGAYESRWHVAGRNADILVGILAVRATELSGPPAVFEQRDRDRHFLGSLPMSSREMGRLPVFEPFDQEFFLLLEQNLSQNQSNSDLDGLDSSSQWTGS
ncbi:unnamed protein product [Mycena citricolor]|uniref:Xylanolytic transcriptional activator regulatory domain-containing protein n=1 Tax=Mycena citricolor TaxID=2018698 RepID=A0AAD2HS58_9AGAR|nr:unnamed protein product [Mycena citricolor]